MENRDEILADFQACTGIEVAQNITFQVPCLKGMGSNPAFNLLDYIKYNYAGITH